MTFYTEDEGFAILIEHSYYLLCDSGHYVKYKFMGNTQSIIKEMFNSKQLEL